MADAHSSDVAGPRHTTEAQPRPTNLVGQSEAGFTLVELLVVMPVLLIVTSLAMVTLVTAYGAGNREQSTSQSSSQVTLAFIKLDSEIRYAADINQPGQDSNNPPNYYVEFQSDWTQNTQGYSGSSLCTQLEYTSTGNLQQRTWAATSSVPTAGWQVLASGLQTTPLSANPFSLSAPQGAPWQLSVAISAVTGTGSAKGAAQSAFTITSLDTTSNSVSQGVCGGTP
jgi:prepilin-type N-terminal cleavage/methylation domain-containing protein